jgi:hypothetical protein
LKKEERKNMETSLPLEKHRQIVETLTHLIRPKAEIVEEGCDVCYVFSREEYELLGTHMGALVAAAKEILVDVRKNVDGYASLHVGDDEMVDKIKGTLDKATGTCDFCERAVHDFLRLLGHFPYEVREEPENYASMPVDTYRMFVLACIGFYTELEWTKGTIIRGDEEENFTKKKG